MEDTNDDVNKINFDTFFDDDGNSEYEDKPHIWILRASTVP